MHITDWVIFGAFLAVLAALHVYRMPRKDRHVAGLAVLATVFGLFLILVVGL